VAEPTLSVVVPVHDERAHIGTTLRAIAAAAARSPFRTEFVVVDDGSTDGTGDEAAAALPDGVVRVLRQSNQGRLSARRAGLAAATGEYVLFLDSRVRLHPDALAFVGERVRAGETVWNAHVVIDTRGNPYGKFWNVLTELAFAAYFADPRTTSFDASNFDSFPKGTTGFLAPASVLRDAFGRMSSYYRDERHANDDTPIIRWIAGQRPIHISPCFTCTYQPRTSLRAFVRHAYHRGVVFLDGHGRRDSRFLPAVLAFYPLSLAGLVVGLRWPLRGAALVAGVAAAAGVFAAARRRAPAEAVAFGALAPVYCAAHGSGMWWGLALLVAGRVGRGARPRDRATP
jgi:glycosyltransferase involved in cell wall biosynthesis